MEVLDKFLTVLESSGIFCQCKCGNLSIVFYWVLAWLLGWRSHDRRLSGVVLESVQPLGQMLVDCLRHRLTVYCNVVNTHLLHVLIHQHCLLDCFTVIRVCIWLSFYLCSVFILLFLRGHFNRSRYGFCSFLLVLLLSVCLSVPCLAFFACSCPRF